MIGVLITNQREYKHTKWHSHDLPWLQNVQAKNLLILMIQPTFLFWYFNTAVK